MTCGSELIIIEALKGRGVRRWTKIMALWPSVPTAAIDLRAESQISLPGYIILPLQRERQGCGKTLPAGRGQI